MGQGLDATEASKSLSKTALLLHARYIFTHCGTQGLMQFLRVSRTRWSQFHYYFSWQMRFSLPIVFIFIFLQKIAKTKIPYLFIVFIFLSTHPFRRLRDIILSVASCRNWEIIRSTTINYIFVTQKTNMQTISWTSPNVYWKFPLVFQFQ